MDGPRAGMIDAGGASDIEQFLTQAERNRYALEQRAKGYPAKFPAKLTGKTFTAGRWAYSWTRQVYDVNGQRIDDPTGMAGTAAFMPAFSYGDGEIVQRFPHETVLRLRGMRVAGDLVYEFPAYCACAAGSGSGGGIVRPCCPGVTLPRDLYATLSSTCACFDNIVFRLAWDPLFLHWIGQLTNLDAPKINACADNVAGASPFWWSVGVVVDCNGGSPGLLVSGVLFGGAETGQFCHFDETAPGNTCAFTITSSGCTPFFIVATATIKQQWQVTGTCGCEGQTVTLTITE